jgi:hypothetical protein
MLQRGFDCTNCGGVNGPGAAVHVDFPSVSNFYIRFYFKQSPGWRSRPNSRLANWIIERVTTDCWWCLSDDGVNCGNYDFSDRWHYFEIHIRQGSGTSGNAQVRIDGVQKHLIWPGYGNNCNAGATSMPAISHVKFDLVQGGGGEQKLLLMGPATHDIYFMVKDKSWAVQNQNDFAGLISGLQWRAIDDVAFSDSGWIGPSDPGDPVSPQPPSGLRIIQ